MFERIRAAVDRINEYDPSRRNFLRVGGEVVVIGALISQGVSPRWLLDSAYAISPEEEYQFSVRKRLTEINNALGEDMGRFDVLAGEVANIAANVFCKELGYSPEIGADLVRKVKFDNQQEFSEAYDVSEGCMNSSPVSPTSNGFTSVGKEQIEINKEVTIAASKNQGTGLVDNLFYTLIHEYHHKMAPEKPTMLAINIHINDDVVIADKAKGAEIYGIWEGQNKPGAECYQFFGQNMEEAIVIDSTDRVTGKYGVGFSKSVQYQRLGEVYKRAVLDRFFDGDNKPILQLHQRSDAAGIYLVIGQAILGNQGNVTESMGAGVSYIKNLLEGIN